MDPFRFGIKSKEEGRKTTRLRRAEDVQTEERVDEVAAGRNKRKFTLCLLPELIIIYRIMLLV